MSNTLKVSKQGLKIIDELRKKKRWKRQDKNWCEKANISVATLKRFWARNWISSDSFENICKAVGADPQEIAENTSDDGINTKKSWKGVPDFPAFYGRTEQLASLKQCIVDDRSRLVAVLGSAGIGKTALCVEIGNQIESQFEYSIWRSLRYASSLEAMLIDIINFLYAEQNIDLPNNVNGLISKLLDALHQHRVLLILDAWENVLSGDRAEYYKPGYEKFGELLQRVGEESHKSCVVITSQEKPEEVTFATNIQTVKSLRLNGLDDAAAIEILKAENLQFADNDAAHLIERYRGNPQYLLQISKMIQELFNGSITEFVRKNTIVVPMPLERVIRERFKFLSSEEKEVLCCLAKQSQPIEREKLRSQISSQISESEFIRTLYRLEGRSLIECISQDNMVLLTLEPVVKKCAKKYIY